MRGKKLNERKTKTFINLGVIDQQRTAFKFKNYIEILSKLGLAFTSP